MDKLCILNLKKTNIPEAAEFIQDEIDRTAELMTNIHKVVTCSSDTALYEYTADLYSLNEYQWKLEDRVRTENSWEAAQAARKNNTQRVNVKNAINALFGYPVEQKKYETQDE